MLRALYTVYMNHMLEDSYTDRQDLGFWLVYLIITYFGRLGLGCKLAAMG